MDFEEKLIEYVRACECLWDVRQQSYRNNPLKDKCWMEIAAKFKDPAITPLTCSKKWKNLKDARAKAISNAKSKSGDKARKIVPYRFAAQMSFLVDAGEEEAAARTASNLDFVASCENSQEGSTPELLSQALAMPLVTMDNSQGELREVRATSSPVSQFVLLQPPPQPQEPEAADCCADLENFWEREIREREENAVLQEIEQAARQDDRQRLEAQHTANRQVEERKRKQQEDTARKQQEDRARKQQEERARKQQEERARRQEEVRGRIQQEDRARMRENETRARRQGRGVEDSDDDRTPAPMTRPGRRIRNEAATQGQVQPGQEELLQTIVRELEREPEDEHTHFCRMLAARFRQIPPAAAARLKVKFLEEMNNVQYGLDS